LLRSGVRRRNSTLPLCSTKLLANNTPEHEFEGALAFFHVRAKRIVDQVLVVPASGCVDLVAEPGEHVVVEPNGDPALTLRDSNHRTAFGPRKVILLTHGLSPSRTGGTRSELPGALK